MNSEQERARGLALRALRDCHVIRVTLGQVPLGYRLLQREGLILATRVACHPDKADVRLRDPDQKEIEL